MGAELEKEQATKKGTELCKSEISKKEPCKYLVFYYRLNIATYKMFLRPSFHNDPHTL